MGSTSIATNASGNLLSETMYKPWGETHYSGGAVMPTDRLYTGQIAEPILGLYFYNARWYDSSLSRFAQADTIIPNPGDPQSWDRYSYVRNSPTGRIDPTGHMDSDDKTGSPRDQRDLTRWFMSAAADSANSPEMQIIRYNNEIAAVNSRSSDLSWVLPFGQNMLVFKSYVGDGKKYDVKDKIYETLRGEVIILDGQAYEYSTVGNMLYGFYGREAGYSLFALHVGAGYAQRDDHKRCGDEMGPFETYMFDTPDDYISVEFGAYLHDKYYDDGILTETELVAALRSFPARDQLNHVPMPAYEPATRIYSTEEFYFGYEGQCRK